MIVQLDAISPVLAPLEKDEDWDDLLDGMVDRSFRRPLTGRQADRSWPGGHLTPLNPHVGPENVKNETYFLVIAARRVLAALEQAGE